MLIKVKVAMATARLSSFCKYHSLWKSSRTSLYALNNVQLSTSTHLLKKSDSDTNKKSGSITNANQQLRYGKVFDKKPARLVLEEGKLYSWCTCGLSKKQPFCDNSHRAFNEADPDKSQTPFKSHKFQVDKKKEYALCNCKQTKNRPFCDGTHKQPFVQDAVL